MNKKYRKTTRRSKKTKRSTKKNYKTAKHKQKGGLVTINTIRDLVPGKRYNITLSPEPSYYTDDIVSPYNGDYIFKNIYTVPVGNPQNYQRLRPIKFARMVRVTDGVKMDLQDCLPSRRDPTLIICTNFYNTRPRPYRSRDTVENTDVYDEYVYCKVIYNYDDELANVSRVARQNRRTFLPGDIEKHIQGYL